MRVFLVTQAASVSMAVIAAAASLLRPDCPPASLAPYMTQVGSTYFVADNETHNFDDAAKFCAELNLTLANVSTPQLFLKTVHFAGGAELDADAWVDVHNPDGTVCDGDCVFQEHSTGLNITGVPEYQTESGGDRCVKMKKDKATLEDEACSEDLYPICSLECGVNGSYPIQRTCPQQPAGDMTPGSGGDRYFTHSAIKMSFSAAQTHCADVEGLALASVINDADYTQTAEYLSGTDENGFWVDIHNPTACESPSCALSNTAGEDWNPAGFSDMVDVATKGDASKSCIRIKNGWVLSSQCNDKYPVCQLDCPPVDGAWSGWSSGGCSGGCPGDRVYTRACDRPAPLNGGIDCPGQATKTRSCSQCNYTCPAAYPHSLLAGYWCCDSHLVGFFCPGVAILCQAPSIGTCQDYDPSLVSYMPAHCPNSHPFAYSGGAACCDSDWDGCVSNYLTRESTCCEDSHVACGDSNPGRNDCYDADFSLTVTVTGVPTCPFPAGAGTAARAGLSPATESLADYDIGVDLV